MTYISRGPGGDPNLVEDTYGVTSPGGFIFGIQGWTWGLATPTSLTFFADNTLGVYDQHGRPMKGTVVNRREVFFAITPPSSNEVLPIFRPDGHNYCTHLEGIHALQAEGIDWRELPFSGWPQVPLDILRSVASKLPNTPIEQLHLIKSESLRRDALRMRLEMDNAVEERKRIEQEQAENDYKAALQAAKGANGDEEAGKMQVKKIRGNV